MKLFVPIFLFLSLSPDLVQGERGLRRTTERKLDHKDSDSKDNDKSKGGGKGKSAGGGGGSGGGSGGDRDFGGGLIYETTECLPFELPDGSIHPLIAGAIDANNGEGEMVNYQKTLHHSQCETNTCGSANSPGCCRVHFKMMICDENNDFGHMPCICNEYTRGPPGAGPVVPIGGEDPIEDRVDPIPEVDPVDPGIPLNNTDPMDAADYVVPEIAVIPAHLKCKRYDPGSNWFLGELNPFDDPTLDPKPFQTCTESEECPGDHCCLEDYCVCSVPTTHAHCLAPYPAAP